MWNIYLDTYIEKNSRFQSFDFLRLKFFLHVSFGRVPSHADNLEF